MVENTLKRQILQNKRRRIFFFFFFCLRKRKKGNSPRIIIKISFMNIEHSDRIGSFLPTSTMNSDEWVCMKNGVEETLTIKKQEARDEHEQELFEVLSPSTDAGASEGGHSPQTEEHETCFNKDDRSFRLDSLYSLLKIINTEDPDGETLQCLVCMKTIPRKNINEFIDNERLHTFPCMTCATFFSHRRDLQKHDQEFHRTEASTSFHCEVCDESFLCACHKLIHVNFHVGEKSGPRSSILQKFSFRKSDENRHLGQKPYRCSLCEKAFFKKNDLINHERTHTGEKPFQCKICHKSFAQKCNLTNHERLHTKEKPFQCGTCSKLFSQKTHLTKHQRVHSGERPFQCGSCDKSFSQKSNLVNHERIHSGERPFQCEICYRSFTDRSNLTQHKRTHSGEKPFQCNICWNFFRKKSALKNHEKRIHKRENYL